MTAVANINPSQSTTSVVAAVKTAAASTGADFDYLLETAVRESSLNPSAKAKTSSATGLFQFIEQTWLGVVKRHGAEFGLEAEAAAINTTSGGRHKVTDKSAREAILALRHDPEVSALMAGALTNESARALEQGIGREATSGELYLAHFMGPSGAIKLINTAESDPATPAASLFPAAAKANQSIFYDGNGRAKSVSEVYDRLTQEKDIGSDAKAALAALDAAPQRVASAGARRPLVHQPADLVVYTQSASQSGAGPLAFALSGGPVSTSRPTLVLTPAVMDVLASLDPLPSVSGNKSDDDGKAWGGDDDSYTIPSRAAANAYGQTLRGTLA
jgi:hypothetical protein